MSASDKFDAFNNSLSPQDRTKLGELVMSKREELLAMRSEDARVRLVDEYTREVVDLLSSPTK